MDQPATTYLFPKGKPLVSHTFGWKYTPTMIGWIVGDRVHKKSSAMKCTRCVFLTEILHAFDIWRTKITCTSIDTHNFKRKRKCQLTFVFVFENVTWHFEFEVECQMKFIKHTQWVHPSNHYYSNLTRLDHKIPVASGLRPWCPFTRNDTQC